MIADLQPPSCVAAEELTVDQQPLEQVDPGILLEVSRRVPGWIRDGVRHLRRPDPERVEHVVPDVRREGLSGCLLDDGATQPVADVRVAVLRARRKREPRMLRGDGPQRGKLVEGGMLVCRMHPSQGNRIRNPRGVRQQLADGDLASVRLPVEVPRDGIVEPKPARFDVLQDGGGRDRLAHRIRHHRRPGQHGAAGRDVGVAFVGLEHRRRPVDDDVLESWCPGAIDRHPQRAADVVKSGAHARGSLSSGRHARSGRPRVPARASGRFTSCITPPSTASTASGCSRSCTITATA